MPSNREPKVDASLSASVMAGKPDVFALVDTKACPQRLQSSMTNGWAVILTAIVLLPPVSIGLQELLAGMTQVTGPGHVASTDCRCCSLIGAIKGSICLPIGGD